MARVRLSAIAVEDLDRLIVTHSLPVDTRARVKRSLRSVERFPRLGRELDGRWRDLCFILGPWRWLLILYACDERDDAVLVVGVHDARSATAATSDR